MNSSIYTDVVEWMAKIVKPQKGFNGVAICPYAKNASWSIVECEGMNIDVDNCQQEVTIFVLPKKISKSRLETYASKLKKQYPEFVFLPDHRQAKTKMKNITTSNGKHNLLLVQQRKKLNDARKNLDKGSYYNNMTVEYKNKLFDY
tara:strand:- start:46 stop:483 length:438 start_codon:yes stop_codon:yes gene_type:complete